MSRPFIVVGDQIDHGGSVVSGSTATDIDGKPVARVGDRVACSKHGPTTIAAGDATLIIDGQPVARHGDKTACGATLISGVQSRVHVDSGGGGNGAAGRNSAAILAAAASAASSLSKNDEQTKNDEQIRFVNANGAKLAEVSYLLRLGDGTSVSGITDSEGRTERIVTEVPTRIETAELTPETAMCCALHATHEGEVSPLIVEVAVTTNQDQVGISEQTVQTPKGESRGMTAGEIAMSRLVFEDAIDYAKVKVHNGEYLWFGMQPDDSAMTPNGEIYFNAKHFREDFSGERIGIQLWFMHEMTHVWQYQLGYPVKMRGAVRIGLSYAYTLQDGKLLNDFNMEAQGNIVADYFALRFRNAPGEINERQYIGNPNALKLLQSTLSRFLQNPADPANLPD